MMQNKNTIAVNVCPYLNFTLKSMFCVMLVILFKTNPILVKIRHVDIT